MEANLNPIFLLLRGKMIMPIINDIWPTLHHRDLQELSGGELKAGAAVWVYTTSSCSITSWSMFVWWHVRSPSYLNREYPPNTGAGRYRFILAALVQADRGSGKLLCQMIFRSSDFKLLAVYTTVLFSYLANGVSSTSLEKVVLKLSRLRKNTWAAFKCTCITTDPRWHRSL